MMDQYEAGPEFDALISRQVMDKCPHPFASLQRWTMQSESGFKCLACGKGDIYGDHCPRYSTDIAAAWLVVERLEQQGWLLYLHVADGEVSCYAQRWNPREQNAFGGGPAPLAICRAALEAATYDAPQPGTAASGD